jgi:hypothetical protein
MMPKYNKPEDFAKKLEPEEPFFCLRARDAISLITLYAYRNALEHHGRREQADDVDKLIDMFAAWQDANQDKVRLAD